MGTNSNVVLVCRCEDSFWVGKASLRSWKRLALEKIEDTESKNGDVSTNGEQIKQRTCVERNTV